MQTFSKNYVRVNFLARNFDVYKWDSEGYNITYIEAIYCDELYSDWNDTFWKNGYGYRYICPNISEIVLKNSFGPDDTYVQEFLV